MSRYDALVCYVKDHGSKLTGKIVKFGGGVSDRFTVKVRGNSVVHISEDGKEHSSVSSMLAYLDKRYPTNVNASGSNTEGGNAANNRIGNYAIYKHTVLDTGISYEDLIHTNTVRKAPTVSVTEQSANEYAVKMWGSSIFADLAESFGKETVIRDRKTLTVSEFAARYGLEVPNKFLGKSVYDPVNLPRMSKFSKAQVKRFGRK